MPGGRIQPNIRYVFNSWQGERTLAVLPAIAVIMTGSWAVRTVNGADMQTNR